ncbi:MAG: helix-hairpin-helix domain-containing protein [Solirubrobacterales bacterium]
MFEAGRTQILIYVVIAAVLLLVGFNSIRSQSSPGDQIPEPAGASANDPGDAAGFSMSADDSKLVVDVSGGVRRPGVYRMAPGTRVIDAIERAGGALPKALPGAINRAAKLADGQQVVVPLAVGAAGAAGVAVAGTAVPDAPVSLGAATPEQLEEIEGIGPVTAQKIIEFRDSKGGVGSIDDLDQVSGIGPVTMEALRSGLQP